MYQIAAKLCHMKPKSQVEGDLPPRLVTGYADIFAIPLKHIFKPDHWDSRVARHMEGWIGNLNSKSTKTIIGGWTNAPHSSRKSKRASSSKGFGGEIILLKEQFGGVKGTSATNFTISVLQEVMEAMETPNTVLNLMSVDYEKVFNRMDNSQCLQALWGLGASSESVGLVHAFLFSRKMIVKINDMKSKQRTAPGGSPQGSILANFLFCATTKGLGRIKNVPNLQRAPSPAFIRWEQDKWIVWFGPLLLSRLANYCKTWHHNFNSNNDGPVLQL